MCRMRILESRKADAIGIYCQIDNYNKSLNTLYTISNCFDIHIQNNKMNYFRLLLHYEPRITTDCIYTMISEFEEDICKTTSLNMDTEITSTISEKTKLPMAINMGATSADYYENFGNDTESKEIKGLKLSETKDCKTHCDRPKIWLTTKKNDVKDFFKVLQNVRYSDFTN